MSKHTLSSLANFLLKSHHEFRELFSSLPSSASSQDPLNIGLRMGSATGTLSFAHGNGIVKLTLTENGRVYQLTLPIAGVANDAAKVKVTLSDGVSTKEHEFEGARLFKAEMPEEFKALHKRVTEYLKTVLPEGLLAKLQEQVGTPQNGAPAEKSDTGADAMPESPAAVAEPSANAAASAQEADDYRWFQLRRDDQPDLRFKGKRIAYAASVLRQGRQNVYEVFITPSGKYVAIKAGLSWWVGERTLVQSQVLDTKEALVEFFGYSPLAKVLYSQLSFDAIEVLE